VRGAVAPLLINKASADSRFSDHPGLKLYGIESYIAVPLRRLNGEGFGTLCALDPLPSDLSEENFEIFNLLASLIAYELEADEQQQKNAAELKAARLVAETQARMMGVLGHDLRNPLSTVKLAAGMLNNDAIPPEKKLVLAGKILSSADRMQQMIEDLLDMTRAQQGFDFSLDRRPYDLRAVCEQIVGEFKIINSNRTIDFSAAGDCRGQFDEGRVAQVFSNLISNALRYGAQNKAVRVDLKGDDSAVVLNVNNQGTPIPPETVPQLFTAFWRGTNDEKGLGLGLYIVEQIMQLHGGTISVESSAEKGTTFTATFPKQAA